MGHPVLKTLSMSSAATADTFGSAERIVPIRQIPRLEQPEPTIPIRQIARK